jgi:hypothetical protein
MADCPAVETTAEFPACLAETTAAACPDFPVVTTVDSRDYPVTIRAAEFPAFPVMTAVDCQAVVTAACRDYLAVTAAVDYLDCPVETAAAKGKMVAASLLHYPNSDIHD